MANVTVTAEEVLPGVYCIEEGDQHRINAYLLVGEDAALLVDTLCECDDLYRRVREITPLPLTVLITHGHGDHAGVSTASFRENGCDVWMCPEDLPVLNGFGGSDRYAPDFFRPLADGMSFTAGEFTLETVAVPGHTPGSVVFLCREKQLMFSGDTVGSGAIWLQIPFCEPLSVFAEGLRKLCGRVEGLKELRLFTGHRYQSPNVLGLEYVQDALHLTEDLVSGAAAGEEHTMDFHGRKMTFCTASRGDMHSYCYDPARLQKQPGGAL